MKNRSSFQLPTPNRKDEPPPEGIRGVLLDLMKGKNLSRPEAKNLLNELLKETANNSQIAAALVALAIKGETVDELTGMAEAMRENSVKINSNHHKFY